MAIAAALAALFIRGAAARARSEAVIAAAGLNLAETHRPTPTLENGPVEELERKREALERAVRLRPGWTEGHLRLGLTNLAMYSATADLWLADSVADPIERQAMADPLWLLRLIREGKADSSLLLKQEPIRQFLRPLHVAFSRLGAALWFRRWLTPSSGPCRACSKRSSRFRITSRVRY